jgi:tetratricopeptide (TPR) repeat protein
MRESGKLPYTVELFPNLKKLSHIEKAEYYSTTRQFDQAIAHYEYALTNKKWAASHPKEWNKAFLKLMAIVVRVKKDPSLAMELISRCRDTQSYPTSLSKYSSVWRSHTKEWRNEKEATSADEKLAAAKKLLERAEMSETETSKKNNLIINIRASGYLHEYLGSNPSNANNGEAILLAGIATEDLTELNLFTLPEDYYETCIRTNPNTELAGNCFKRLEKIAEKMKTDKLLAASSPGLLGRVDELRALSVKK